MFISAAYAVCLHIKINIWISDLDDYCSRHDDDDDAQAFIELLLDISLALNIAQNNAK